MLEQAMAFRAQLELALGLALVVGVPAIGFVADRSFKSWKQDSSFPRLAQVGCLDLPLSPGYRTSP
eukprot:6259407-Amphidinium_carterae.1